MSASGSSIARSGWQGGFIGSPGAAPRDRPPAPAWPQYGVADRRGGLDRAVALDVLPRLVLAGRGAAGEPRIIAAAAPIVPVPALLASDIEAFARLVLNRDTDRAMAYADRVRAGGLSHEALYLDLLAPTARHLGELWNEDLVDFSEVTIGLGHLHSVLRELSPAFQSGVTEAPQSRRALLVAAPGEQHTFGLAMVTEFFRRAAWVVWSGAPAPGPELVGIVRDNWFSMVGFSLAYEGRLDALRTGIRGVRRASRNPDIRVMVGGPVFIEHPEFVAQVGADAMAIDGRQAVQQAHSLLTLLPACV
jgi:methanogenic corrinoid protein MtbC1